MRHLILPLVLVLAIPQTGCIGKFALTKKIYDFNHDISPDLVVQELVFLGMLIIPVYGFGLFIDAVILNTVETFTGENPISSAEEETRVVDMGDRGTLYMIPRGRNLRLEHVVDGDTTVHILRRSADATELLDAGNNVLRRIQSTADGSIEIQDGEGAILQSFDGDQVIAATTSWYMRTSYAVAELN